MDFVLNKIVVGQFVLIMMIVHLLNAKIILALIKKHMVLRVRNLKNANLIVVMMEFARAQVEDIVLLMKIVFQIIVKIKYVKIILLKNHRIIIGATYC